VGRDQPWLDEPAVLRRNFRPCANLDHDQRSVSYSERRRGYGYGASSGQHHAPLACAVACASLDLLARHDNVARIAGIAGAKRTPDLIPLCHPIGLHGVTVDLTVTDEGVDITAVTRTADRTGVEMEALTSVSVAALALIDMVKAIDPAAVITDVRVEWKEGGKTGPWRRPERTLP